MTKPMFGEPDPTKETVVGVFVGGSDNVLWGDAPPRWVDSLPDDLPTIAVVKSDLSQAAYWLGLAADPRLERRHERTQWAAAHIRRHRKSLSEKAEREDDWPPSFSDEQLIWGALHTVAVIGRRGDCEDSEQAMWCRSAEAALRTYWKRKQLPTGWVKFRESLGLPDGPDA